MAKEKTTKKKLITFIIIAAALILLIGSFFLRDILLRAGITEFERGEILQVKEKYSSILDDITAEALSCGDFTITVTRKGIFERSLIEYDENSASIKEKLSESVDVLCHGYCWGISKANGTVYFDFNKSGTKRLAYGEVAENEGSSYEDIGNGWTYIQPSA